MIPESIISIIKDFGLLGAITIIILYSYISLTSKILPLLEKHNDELHQLITLTQQILERLRNNNRPR